MSNEAAAATLTQIYFASLQSERDRLTGRTRDEPYAIGAVEKIGTVYGAFLAKMDRFEQLGKT